MELGVDEHACANARSHLRQAQVLLKPISDGIFNKNIGTKKDERLDMGRKINSAAAHVKSALIWLGSNE